MTKSEQENPHESVKPEELMRLLIELVSEPGDLILDPFAGSGSTGVACAYAGRTFFGIERDKETYEDAEARIAHAERISA